MWTWVTGGLSVLVASAFLSAVALKVSDWALWLAVVIAVACLLFDYVASAREGT